MNCSQLFNALTLVTCFVGLQNVFMSAALAQPSQKSEVEITCKVTSGGYGYDLHLTRGFAEPKLIQAAIDAIYSAMPFKIPEEMVSRNITADCVISNDASQKVRVNLIQSTLKNDDNENVDAILKSLPYPEKEFKSDSVIRSWMGQRLSYLLTNLYYHPDNAKLQAEIKKTMAGYYPDGVEAHDWLSVARLIAPKIVIMRNPTSDTKKTCRQAAAAYFEAWKLSHDPDSLLELKNAYAKVLTCQVLSASKADPQLLASAAILANEYKEAKSEYKLAAEIGNQQATIILERQKQLAKNLYTKSNLKPAAECLPGGKDSDWQKVLHWLPADCETLIAVKGPLGGAKQTDSTQLSSAPAKKTDCRLLFENLVTPAPIQENKDWIALLHRSAIAVTVHAGRNFKFPDSWGTGTQQAAEVVVFKDLDEKASTNLMDKLQANSDWSQRLEGVTILAFDPGHHSLGGQAGRDVAYLCSPMSGVIINTSNLQFLRIMFERMKNPSIDQAFPSDLEEWKKIDTTADSWALRHYDKSCAPFDYSALEQLPSVLGESREDFGSKLDRDAIGFVVTAKPDGSPDLQLIPEQKKNLLDGQPKMSKEKEAEQANLLGLILMIKLGYIIAI